MQIPQDLVKSFIEDYFEWSIRSSKASEGENWNSTSVMESIKNDYLKNIIQKYCPHDFKGENVAFSSEPAHCPINEFIVSVESNSQSATVTTRHSSDSGSSADYEYSFMLINKHWYLRQVYYLSDGKKYPSL